MDQSQPNEQTPLFSPEVPYSNNVHTISSCSTKAPSSATPMPWSQIVPVCLLLIAEAASFSCIFPFITEFLTSINTPQDKIGLYGGIAEGSLMLIEASCAIFWAKLADRFGRKKCLILGFILPVCSTALVGFGKSAGWIIFWRAIAGFNPAQTVNRVIPAEISDPSNRARIYAITDPAFTVGIVLGVTLGGELSSPYHKLPRWLGGEVVSITALLVNLIMLKESKPLEANTQPEEQQITRLADALKVPHYKTVLLVWSVYQFANMAICQGFYMVWGYTPVPSGGLGLSVENNGRLIAMAELAYVFTSPLMVPMIQKGLGAKRGLLLTTGIIPVEALGIPLVQWAATKGRKATYETLCLQYGMTTLHAYSLPIAHQFFVACFDDYPHLRATGMALSLIAGSAGKATGPAVGGWLYSYSTQFPAGSVGRQISWTVLFCLVLPAVILTSFIPKQLEKKAGSGHGGDEEEVEGLLHNHAE